MTDLTQTMQWLTQSVTGQTPVWDSTGAEVAYRSGPGNSVAITFLTAYKGDTTLFSKNSVGADCTIILTASEAAEALDSVGTGPLSLAYNEGPTTAANYPTGSLAATVTSATQATGDAINAGINDIVNATNTAISWADFWTQYQVPILAGGAGLLILLLLMRRRHA